MYRHRRLMRRVEVLVVLVIAAAVVYGGGSWEAAAADCPAVYLEKLGVPDMTQTDPRAKLPNGGRSYCGPVAVSNSLMWLAGRGFANLLPDLKDREKVHFELARILGRYMNTNPKTGTGATGLARGVVRYIEDRGYHCDYVGYQGWRKHPKEFSSGVDVPQLSWIKSALQGDSAVWLNIGWYKYDAGSDRYRRIGGHWVTLVGYGAERSGKPDPAVLIIRDPAPRSGMRPWHQYVRLKRISSGSLEGKDGRSSRSAEGFYILAEGLKVRSTADFGLLDGVVALKISSRP